MTCHGIMNRVRKELEARAASHGVCIATVVADREEGVTNMTSPSASQPLGEPVPGAVAGDVPPCPGPEAHKRAHGD